MILAVVVLFFAAQAGGSQAYERASKLFAETKFAESLASVEEALRANPRSLPALTLKAKLAMAAKRYDVARETLEQALVIDPRAAYIQFLYGLQFYMANDLPLASTQLQKARQLNPSDARAAQYLGMTEESMGHPRQALALYEEAAKLAPRDADILLTGARLLSLMNRDEECGQWLEKTVKLDSNSRDAHFEMARLLLKRGNLDRAAQEGEIALRLVGETTDSQIHYVLSKAYRQNNPAEAARHAAALR